MKLTINIEVGYLKYLLNVMILLALLAIIPLAILVVDGDDGLKTSFYRAYLIFALSSILLIGCIIVCRYLLGCAYVVTTFHLHGWSGESSDARYGVLLRVYVDGRVGPHSGELKIFKIAMNDRYPSSPRWESVKSDPSSVVIGNQRYCLYG